VIRTADDSVIGAISVGSHPWGVAALPSGNYVYVTNSHGTNVTVIRTTDNTVVNMIEVGDAPTG
jgi:YVTN family beta-propeller protein